MSITLTNPISVTRVVPAEVTATKILLTEVRLNFPYDVVQQPPEGEPIDENTRATQQLWVKVTYWEGNETPEEWEYEGRKSLNITGADASAFVNILVARGQGWGRATQEVAVQWLTDNGYIPGGTVDP